jgi:hypothetical protein
MLGKKSGGEVFSREKAEEKRFRERRKKGRNLTQGRIYFGLTKAILNLVFD